jgi:hypothetical protein
MFSTHLGNDTRRPVHASFFTSLKSGRGSDYLSGQTGNSKVELQLVCWNACLLSGKVVLQVQTLSLRHVELILSPRSMSKLPKG